MAVVRRGIFRVTVVRRDIPSVTDVRVTVTDGQGNCLQCDYH